MPPVVLAAIITGGAGVAATGMSARSARKANERAVAAETAALDKQLAESRRANEAALAWERDIENRRRQEWDQQQADERAQWEWYEGAMQPYRDASRGALGSLASMVERLGGSPINFGGAPPAGAPAGAPAASSAWSPSDLVRTAAPRRAPVAAMGAPARMSRVASPNVAGTLENAMGMIADLVKNLPERAPNYMSDAYLG